MANQKLACKNKNIKTIFEKMEYGEVLENTDSAKLWFTKHLEILSYGSIKTEVSKGMSTVLKDIHTGQKLTTVFSPVKSDIEKIILYSKQHNNWISMKAEERAYLLNRLAGEIQRNSTLICELEVCVRGILSIDTKLKALPILIDYLQYYSSFPPCFDPGTPKGLAVCLISDSSFVGFLGCILGPALASGCNIIVQSEPKISSLILLIIELAEYIGIPEGTITLIPGFVDAPLIFENENVSTVITLGNFNTDLIIPVQKTFLAISNSKNPLIIFNNADIDSACDAVIDAAWGYQGLLPWSINTVLVQEDVLQTVIEKLKLRLSKTKMSSAIDKSADVSYPNIDATKRLHTLINEAKLQGVEVFQSIEKGDLFQPTLLIGGRVFGNNMFNEDDNTSIVTILAFRTASEAINLANNSRYGFGASVWTENIGLANEVSKGLKVSNVWINSHGCFTASAPFSPCKKSGAGIFGGSFGYYEYCTVYELFRNIDFKPNIGLSNKSEAPVKNVYNCPVGNDFHKVVMVAKKAYQEWCKTTLSFRCQFIRTIANEMKQNILELSEDLKTTQEELNQIIRLIYMLPTLLHSGITTTFNNFNVQTWYEPTGVVAIEVPDQIKPDMLLLILGSMVFGNAVIVLCSSNTTAHLYKQILRIMLQGGIPPGVHNIITYYNDNVMKTILCDKEIDLYIPSRESNIKVNIKHMPRGVANLDCWSQTLNHTMLFKNVWTNIGHSVI